MKTLSIVFFTLLLSFGSQAQVADTNMIVNGVCGMCQRTIETAALALPGVEAANWDKHTKQLSLKLDSSEVKLAQVSQAVNAAGYDTEYNTAPDEAYYGLHSCCYYRDPKVVEDHDKEE